MRTRKAREADTIAIDTAGAAVAARRADELDSGAVVGLTREELTALLAERRAARAARSRTGLAATDEKGERRDHMRGRASTGGVPGLPHEFLDRITILIVSSSVMWSTLAASSRTGPDYFCRPTRASWLLVGASDIRSSWRKIQQPEGI